MTLFPFSQTLPPHLRRVFAGLIVAMALAALDQSIVNTALPRMAADLGGLAHLSWVVTAFMLTSTVSTPIYGKLSDMFGRRRFLLGAVTLFLLMSALCGLAQSMGQLIGFRFLQGIGAGGIMTLSQTVVSDLVSPRERVRYQGLFSASFAFANLAGPLLGGALTTLLSWRWVFYINLPLGGLALVLLWRALPQGSPRRSHRIDYAGAGLLVVGASALLLLFSLGGSLFAWGSGASLLLGALALGALAAFFRVEARAEEPIINLRLFRIPSFATGVLTMSCMGFAMQSAVVFLPLYLQLVLGLNPAQAGAMLLPQVLAMMLTSTFGGQWSAAIGRPKAFMVTGIAFEAAGLGLMALLAMLQAPYPWFWLALAMLGTGMGIAMPNATAIVQNAVPRDSIGSATATMSFLRSLGGTLGVAVSGGVVATRLGAELAKLSPGLDIQAMNAGGVEAAAGLPETLRPAVDAAFRHAITGAFEIGGLIMTLALVCALSLRGTGFAAAPPRGAADGPTEDGQAQH